MLSHQSLEFETAGGSGVSEQILDKNAEACHDNEEIEQDHNLNEYGHSRDENLRTQKDAVFEDQETKDLAEGFVPHRKHQEANQFHGQHDGEGQNGHRGLK